LAAERSWFNRFQLNITFRENEIERLFVLENFALCDIEKQIIFYNSIG